MNDDAGHEFQELTKYRRGELPSGRRSLSRRPEPFKGYPGAVRFSLPKPEETTQASLWDALRNRRSVRNYAPAPLTQAELSLLLWSSQGVTRLVQGFALRTAPSAGALYPVETYLSAQNIEDLPSGLYHYGVLGHDLEQLASGDMREALARAALDQDFIASAPAVFIWTAIFARSTWKYRDRAYRYVYLDAGHIAQNVALAAASLGLGTCPIAALYDDEVNALLGIDGQVESVVYMTSAGRPRSSA
jgi:SagB-type dehydrogenase family enzyme